jgi:catechol-2,3-dioxygenase
LIITDLKIFSNNIDNQKHFFQNVLGFELSKSNNQNFEIKAGSSKLSFHKSRNNFFYHFAFFIPTGSINSAIDFLEERSIDVLPLNNEKIVEFTKGRAVYFYDLDVNIVEFIQRPTLNYKPKSIFDIKDIIKLNEIGLPVSNPKEMTNVLKSKYGIIPINKAPFTDRF